MLNVRCLICFLGGGFGCPINSKRRRAYSREIRSEKASEFSQAGFVNYSLSLLIFLNAYTIPFNPSHILLIFVHSAGFRRC